MYIKKIFEEKESIKKLKILGLINIIEKYQKIYNHAWKKTSIKNIDCKNRRNKKLFTKRNNSKWINELET